MSCTGTGTLPWTRLVRILLIFAALSALLLMHGMSGDHDLNETAVSAVLVADASAGASRDAPAHDHDAPSAHAPTRFVALDHAAAPTSDHRGHGHGGAQACLALLTVSLVAIGSMRGSTRVSAVSGLPPLPRAAWISARSAGVATKAPALSVLCLLRT